MLSQLNSETTTYTSTYVCMYPYTYILYALYVYIAFPVRDYVNNNYYATFYQHLLTT